MITHAIRLLIVALVALLAHTTAAQPAPAKVMEGVSAAMKQAVEKKEVSGAVTMVVSKDGILHSDVVGHADIEAKKPMTSDSMFWIASMTKPITGTAIMMLVEEGKLSLDDPVGKHIPELAELKTADGKPAVVTIKHLLTHTSGMGEISAEQAVKAKTLAEVIPMYAALPLKFEPGTKWTYCQSSINTAGRVVEVVSGKPFEQFLQERLFGPLGMKDTTFYVSEEQLPRVVKAYRRSNEGELAPANVMILYGKPPTSRDRFPAANGGLYSTAPDYARFCQMLLNKGTFEGKRLLKPETVEWMTGVHSGDLKTGFTEGNGWGIGFCVVREPQGVSAALSPGSFGHGGAYGTQAWVDPKRNVAYILMVQRANFPNADNSDVRKAFQTEARKAMQ